MAKFLFYFFLITIFSCYRFCLCQYYAQPEQIHLSYTGDPTEMIVTWVTMSPTNHSLVEYGDISFSTTAKGVMEVFQDNGYMKRILYIHRVKLDGLIPDHKYKYHCGSEDGWSGSYYFQSLKSGSDWSPRLCIFGDMGSTNAKSLGHMQEDVQNGMYDMLLHVGDFAYNMDSNNGETGDNFMRQVESVAAYVPYMTCVGNHENAYNFSHYRRRFSMPANEGYWYSFNLGPVHFVAISTEVYHYVQYGWELIAMQYEWIEKDLKKASLPENRAQQPWIIVFGHRPMYCSNDDPDICTKFESMIRKGLPNLKLYGLEDLLYKYGVDIEIWAHEHSYERLWPVYDRRVYNGSYFEPYVNPRAPVHIITGSAGCSEGETTFVNPLPWTAFRAMDYGFTRMKIYNKTHLYFEQVSEDKGGKILDRTWIVKENHGYNAWFY